MTPMTIADAALLVGAGTAAGIVGSAGGTASLIAYPALLAAGISPLDANVTGSLAVVTLWPGSALSSRPELRGQGPWLRRWTPLVIAGSAAGAALLLLTPATVFDRIVPFLIAFAAVALLLQPMISTWMAGHPAVGDSRLLLPAGLLMVSVYSGYWGAGAGIMTLLVVMVTTGQDVVRSNALKNMLLGAADLTCCLVFVLFWPVDVVSVVAMGAGFAVGGVIGPTLARRIAGPVLRIAVALAGLAFAVRLGVQTY